MSIDEQPMNVYWSGQKSLTSNKYKADYKKLVEGLEPSLNWQKTGTASSVAFYPLSTTPLNPVVAFVFTETGPVSGTKGPDNPSTITDVSSITVTRCETTGVDEAQYTVNLSDSYPGGSVDVSTGQITVSWWEHAFDGTEEFSKDASHTGTYYHYSYALDKRASATSSASTRACSHLQFVNNLDQGTLHFACTQATFHIFVPFASLDDLKSWLSNEYEAGHPVTLLYSLETVYPMQCSPVSIYSLPQQDKYTPRLNTVYTDASSVQVGYAKSPIRSEYELN